MSAAALLGQAERLLDGSRRDGLSSRMAAFLARQALEVLVDERCRGFGVENAGRWGPSMRSRLVVLRALDTREVADAAALAWNRLSRACHVHAFELQPSAAEVRQLCELVASLLPS